MTLVDKPQLPAVAVEELDRSVDDYSQQQPLLPLKPFEIEGYITSCNWERFQGAAPKGQYESEGLKYEVVAVKVDEPAFRTGKGVETAKMLKAGDTYASIYFAKHPKLTFALPEHAAWRRALLACIAEKDANDPAFKPSAVLQQLQGLDLHIPIRIRRVYVRTTRNGADLFSDRFELLKK
jgi:hypothetical protein